MKVLVSVKHVVDYNVKVRVKGDGSDVDIDHVKMSINPFDEIAMEAAVQWKEQGIVDEIVAVSIGNPACQETLRHALALGADRGILIETTDNKCEPLQVATCLKTIVEQEKPDCVLMGKQSIDGDNNQTPQMLAGLLGWPQATFASKIELETTHATVTREIDSGSETLQVTLPAVISADLRLNVPRYLSLPNIMQARRKPITIQPLSDLGIDTTPHTTLLQVMPPPTRPPGKRVHSVDELISCLKEEGVIT